MKTTRTIWIEECGWNGDEWRNYQWPTLIWSQIPSYTTSKYSIFDHKSPQSAPKVDTLGVNILLRSHCDSEKFWNHLLIGATPQCVVLSKEHVEIYCPHFLSIYIDMYEVGKYCREQFTSKFWNLTSSQHSKFSQKLYFIIPNRSWRRDAIVLAFNEERYIRDRAMTQ